MSFVNKWLGRLPASAVALCIVVGATPAVL
jgi:hypothetical protein